METIRPATDIALPTPAEAAVTGLTQRRLLLEELRALTPGEWEEYTDCTRWRVRDVAAHVVAACENAAHPRRLIAGMAFGRLRHGGDSPLDAMNEVGIDRRRSAPPAQILDDLERLAPLAVAPGWFRRMAMIGGGLEPGTTGAILVDVILVRDVWLHRHDIASATSRQVKQDPSDSSVVALVVRDLSKGWRQEGFRLELTGHEGGTWFVGQGDPCVATPTVRLPAVEFMRHLSGRTARSNLFADTPPSVREPLLRSRVVF